MNSNVQPSITGEDLHAEQPSAAGVPELHQRVLITWWKRKEPGWRWPPSRQAAQRMRKINEGKIVNGEREQQ